MSGRAFNGSPPRSRGFVAALPAPRTRQRARRRVSVLLPARNEETGLQNTLARLPLHEIEALGHDVELVVVDGNSTDRTRDVAREAGARVLVQTGMGKGIAVRGALRALDSDYVIMLDADSTYPTERIPDFVRFLDEGYDVVMGSRLRGFIDDDAMRGLNLFGNASLSAVATFAYGRRCTDVCTGMWGLRREVVAELPLRRAGFEIEAELYAESMKGGLNVIEVPIRYGARSGETKLSKFADGVRIARTLLECRLRDGFRPFHERPPARLPDGEALVQAPTVTSA